ncbi:substrate-binding periplasmic protein [Simiduia agarivorans]|uniref:Uncharacterized protein n=1 Tax=Simiduia agarivorans (strain DSM 21679 / JCM 13881 / BCRC 17597 / SA1) TaxID=1117647 RepID=K4KJ32_SIMAS|nr:transporter substrate-binding domain-containing protein [Simiduia agarivorans]AFU98180.1 hypothetical protein M5M_04865 [Simiduia agarivorans SA1 = DSM 21679]
MLKTLSFLLLFLVLPAQAADPLTEIRLQTLGPDTARFPGLLHYETDANGTLALRGRYRDLLDCTASQLGIRVVYTGKPFIRAQRDAVSGQIHGFFPANRTARRNSFAIPSEPLFEDRKVLLARPEFSKGTKDPRKLTNYIGVMRGAQYEQALAETLEHPLSVVDSYEQLLKMLETRRVGAIVVSEMFINSTLTYLDIKVDLRTKVLEQAPMYAYFSQAFVDQYPTFLDQFNNALDHCRTIPRPLQPPGQHF